MSPWTSSTPHLIIPKHLLPEAWASMGLLTPRALRHSPGIIRVFLAGRGTDGRGRIFWIDVDDLSLEPVATSGTPVLDVGANGAFDQDGVILGDVFYDKVQGRFTLCYVGFQRRPTVKFVAKSGLASSATLDGPFHRVGELTVEPSRYLGTRYIEAVHQVRVFEDQVQAELAIGTGWHKSLDSVYPAYMPWTATGPDLLSLSLGTEPSVVLPASADVYRLGRPGVVSLFGEDYLVATGMTTSQRYQPYLFEQTPSNDWMWRPDLDIGVLPGCHPSALSQAAYPSVVASRQDEAIVFFVGDEMGRDGILCLRLTRKQ
jgi:hypothetical protein